jgi:hypothetical protein
MGLGVAGIGVAATGVGAAFGFLAKGKLDDSNHGPCNPSDQCTGSGLSMRKDAENFASISTVLFVAGGAAVAGGLVLFAVAPRAPAPAALTVTPMLAAGAGGALVSGRFQ